MLANFWGTLLWLGLIHFLQKFAATVYSKQYIGSSGGSEENRWTFEEKNILMVI